MKLKTTTAKANVPNQLLLLLLLFLTVRGLLVFRTRYISGSQERLDCEGWGVSQWNSGCLSIYKRTTTTKAKLYTWGISDILMT